MCGSASSPTAANGTTSASWARVSDRFPISPLKRSSSGIERFAGTLPAQDRIYNLLNANPLHMDRNRNVSD